jgi:acetyl esterase/lipase
VYVPKGYTADKPAPVLVGLHPWNGNPWTYAAYQELAAEADARGVVLLFPSGLGNTLYTAPSEDEVMRALAALQETMRVDETRISIFGASMGGQGATTVGWHRPSTFASVTSLFGDAKFDLSTNVRNLLPTEEDARRINPIDVVDNARHLPTWLIHGEDDRTAPIVQSEMLEQALKQRKYAVTFDREPGHGHDGILIIKHAKKMLEIAATAIRPTAPARVTFRSVREEDREAYGITLVRTKPGPAFFDIELKVDPETKKGTAHVFASDNVSELRIDREGVLEGSAEATFEPGVPALRVTYVAKRAKLVP